MPTITTQISVGGTAKQLSEYENFTACRNGSGEAVGEVAAADGLSAMNVGLHTVNTKDGGPPIQVVQSYSLLRYFMVFPIIVPSDAVIKSASLTLTSAGYTIDHTPNFLYYQQKSMLVAASLGDETSVAAGDYDSINVSSMTAYCDSEGLLIASSIGVETYTQLNAAAVEEINNKKNQNFVMCLMERTHDYLNNGIASYQGLSGGAAEGRCLDGCHVAEQGENGEPVLTLNFYSGGTVRLVQGLVKLQQGHVSMKVG